MAMKLKWHNSTYGNGCYAVISFKNVDVLEAEIYYQKDAYYFRINGNELGSRAEKELAQAAVQSWFDQAIEALHSTN